jgi:site-specific DNA-cytosine methylase
VTDVVEVLHFHLFCGLGGAASGMNRSKARLGAMQARGRCIGGVDVVPAAVRDFERLSGVRGTLLDLFDRGQYLEYHGHEPPADWREATPEDLRRAAGGERPNILFTSPPCQGLSGLLSQNRSQRGHYQALNRLTVRGIWLALTAWEDDPPEFFLLENVPRIETRGRALIDQIEALFRAHGYAVAPSTSGKSTYCCGELGGLAQKRRRFLLAGRHREKVPPFLYEPPRRRVRGVGEVIGALPRPEAPAAGPMHRLPRLQWRTWLRLALVEAGSDWRSLERLRVVDGHLADLAITPEGADYFSGPYGVGRWDDPARTITSQSGPSNGQFAVADPHMPCGAAAWNEGRRGLGVVPWDQATGTLTSQSRPGQGAFAVADVRTGFEAEYGQYGVLPWDRPTGTIKGDPHVGTGRYAVADPQLPAQEVDRRHRNLWRIVRWGDPSGTIIGASRPGSGALSVADPHLTCDATDRERRRFNDVFRVVRYDDPACAVTAGAGPSSGAQSVADPGLPAAGEQCLAVIRALDGTWHRPFTTLDIAALQGLVDPEEVGEFELDGTSHSGWRGRIGNAVPSPAAEAIGSVMFHALLLARAGERFALGSTPVWVRPLVVAISVETPA